MPSATPTTPRGPLPSWLFAVPFVALGVAAFAWGVAMAHGFVIDDAGISYAYALHLAEGEGLRAVVGGPVVEGYSNFLWVLLLAAGQAVGFSPPVASEALGVAFGLSAGLLGLCAVPRTEGEGARRAPFTYALPLLFLGLTPTFVVWTVSGLENGLFALLLTALVVADLREARTPSARTVSGAVAFLLCLTRPEGLLYAGLLGLVKLAHAVVAPAYRRPLLAFGLSLLVPLTLYHGWHYVTFGDVWPNTYYAKAPGLTEATATAGAKYLRDQVVKAGVLPLLPLALLGLYGPVRERLPLGLVLGGVAFFAVYSGGDWMPHGRFVSYGAPVFAIALHLGSRRVLRALDRGPLRRRPAAAAALLLVGLALLLFSWAPTPVRALRRVAATGWCHFCNRMEDEARLDALSARLGLRMRSVLIHDFGAVAYRSSPSRYAYDSLGLCDRTLARLGAESEGPARFAAERARIRYLFHEQDRPPTFLYVPRHFWPGVRETAEYRLGYWELPLHHLSSVVRPGTVFAVHRAAFLDYYPDVAQLLFLPVGEGLVVRGLRAEPSEQGLRVRLYVQRPEGAPARPEMRVAVRRAGDDGEGVEMPLFGGDPDLHRQWVPGEPAELDLVLGGTATGPVALEIAVRGLGPPPSWSSLPAVEPVVGATADRPWRFPVELPAARDPELAALAPEVRALRRERALRRDERVHDPVLGARLADLAARLEARDVESAEDAYLARVWALEVDRDLDGRLYAPLLRGRPDTGRLPFALEIALLRAFHRTGDRAFAARLAAHHRAMGRESFATYLEARVPGLRAGASGVRPLAGVDGDFEEDAPAGWLVRDGGFVSGRPRGGIETLGGHLGRSLLVSSGDASSLRGALAARGRWESAPFPLDGRMLSFAAGGRGDGPAVELWVGDQVVRRFEGPLERHLEVVLWDVSAWSGSSARLVVVDDSPGAVLAVDAFRLWD